MAQQHSTEWVRRYWDRSADRYDRTIGWFGRRFVRDGREWIASRAHGDVVEVDELERSDLGVMERASAQKRHADAQP